MRPRSCAARCPAAAAWRARRDTTAPARAAKRRARSRIVRRRWRAVTPSSRASSSTLAPLSAPLSMRADRARDRARLGVDLGMARRELGPAAQAGAKAVAVGLGRGAVERAALAARRARAAHRPAVHAGRLDGDEEQPVEARVAREQRAVASVGVERHVSIASASRHAALAIFGHGRYFGGCTNQRWCTTDGCTGAEEGGPRPGLACKWRRPQRFVDRRTTAPQAALRSRANRAEVHDRGWHASTSRPRLFRPRNPSVPPFGRATASPRQTRSEVALLFVDLDATDSVATPLITELVPSE